MQKPSVPRSSSCPFQFSEIRYVVESNELSCSGLYLNSSFKADLQKYRDAGKEVIQTLLTFNGAVIERASIDEAYLDITKIVEERMAASSEELKAESLPNSFLVKKGKANEGWLSEVTEANSSDDIRLAHGAAIVEEMRAAVKTRTEFECSAGISYNKMLAKLACGINKPNKQTILPHSEVEELFSDLKITKLRGLGGKLGDR